MMRLLGYDLLIESSLAIPGTVAAGDEHRTVPDLRVRCLSALPAPAATAPLYRREGEDVVFSPLRGAVYRCRRDEIAITPYAGADPDVVMALLIATALPASLWLRGRFVLHAAALRLPGSDCAIAIAGPSGIGKSTAAAAAIARGAELVADDTLSLDVSPARVAASGLAGGYFRADPQGQTRAFHPVASAGRMRPLPLGAVVILAPEDATSGLMRLGSLTAMHSLLANQHRPRIPALLGRRPEVLRACAILANTVPVYAWHRRRGATDLDPREWDALSTCGAHGLVPY